MEDPFFTSDNNNSEANYRQYNPYKDLQVHPVFPQQTYNLPTSLEHLFEEEALKTGPNISENITYYTATTFLAGTILGAAKGTLEGIHAAERGESAKIRLSRVVNTGGLVGRRLGNMGGILGLIYAGVDTCIATQRGKHDMVGSVLAGLGTGALFRVASGVRSAAVGGALGGVAAAAFVGGRHLLKRYAPAYM